MAFTNHHDAIVVGEDSRRWWVVKSKLQHKEQIRAIVDKDPEYFARFAESLTTHAGGYRYMFENRVISSTFRPSGPAPTTSYLQEMITDTSDDVTAVLNRIWQNDECPLIQADAVAVGALRSALDAEGVKNVTPKYLTHVLRNAGFSPSGRHMIAGERQYVWARADRLNGRDPVKMLVDKSENSSNSEDS
jgi:hypothetical protein